jgi:Mrp family chromosome partitioning ATPase
MFKLRKKVGADESGGAPLAISAADNALQHVFDASIVNSFRHMATELAYTNTLPRRLAVIAALRGEGVTYTALALGATLASDMATRVCVIELNWWAPGLLAQLDPARAAVGRRSRRATPAATPAAARPGLAQVLSGAATLDQAMVVTDQPNLSLLPAGELPVAQRPSTARSGRLRELIDSLSERYDHLLFDVPAILSTSDSIALASFSEACLLVIRHGITSGASAGQALDDVRHLTILGAVLNQSSVKTPRWIRALIPQE